MLLALDAICYSEVKADPAKLFGIGRQFFDVGGTLFARISRFFLMAPAVVNNLLTHLI
jgi:hypothetical protein